MARIVSSSYSPIIGINIVTTLDNGEKSVKEYHIDDMVENLRYVDGETVKTISGRLSNINYKGAMTSHKYSDLSTLRSYFADDIKCTSIEIDTSTDFHSNVTEIPAREIVEDAGVHATRVHTEMTLACSFKATLTDDTEAEFVVNEGDDLKQLTYMTRGGDVTIDCRVVAFRYNAKMKPLSMIVVANGRVQIIDFITVKTVQGVSVCLNPCAVSLTEALDQDEDGYISIGPGETNQGFNVNKTAVIRGSKAGIPPKARVKNGMKDETILTGPIQFAENIDVTLDGLVLEKDAYLKFHNSPNITIQNCIIKGLIPSTGSNSFPLYLVNGGDTKLTVIANYFGKNLVTNTGTKMKNALELNTPIADGSIINGNYFEDGVCRNNHVCVYDAVDGATIEISKNHFEHAANGIRVGTKGDKQVTINAEHNSYDSTDPGAYAGLMIIQPYATQTISFAKHVININDTQHSDSEQLFYLYYNSVGDTQITDELKPTVIVDGEVVMAPIPVNTDGDEGSDDEVVAG